MPEVAEKIISEEKSFRIEVTKNSKGYTWSVKASGDDSDKVKEKIQELEAWCKSKYSSQE